jgi:predicted transcriptional regulator
MTNESKAGTKLEDMITILDAQVLCGQNLLSVEVRSVSASDMMSDALTFAKEDSLMVTGLINRQVVRTAEMAGIVAICFVRGKMPQEETIMLAKEKNITLLATKLSMFETCGRLYKKGLRGGDETK